MERHLERISINNVQLLVNPKDVQKTRENLWNLQDRDALRESLTNIDLNSVPLWHNHGSCLEGNKNTMGNHFVL